MNSEARHTLKGMTIKYTTWLRVCVRAVTAQLLRQRQHTQPNLGYLRFPSIVLVLHHTVWVPPVEAPSLQPSTLVRNSLTWR